MRDDEEAGAEQDTFDSDQPDRDRETSQGARRPPAAGTPATRPSPGESQRHPDAPASPPDLTEDRRLSGRVTGRDDGRIAQIANAIDDRLRRGSDEEQQGMPESEGV
jgi:hypothetical protein